MSKVNKNTKSITRDLKIDETGKKNTKYSDIPLNSVTQKFIKEPLTIEALNRKMKEMNNEVSKQNDEEGSKQKKNRKQEEKAIFFDIFIKPKEKKIEEIVEKRKQKQNASVTPVDKDKPEKPYISNKVVENGKILGMNNTSSQTNANFAKFTTSTITTTEEFKLTKMDASL